MDKLTMAHEVACAMINNGCAMHTAIADDWEYADEMQEEVDKRKPMVQGGYPKPIGSSVGGVIVPASVDCSHRYVISSGECLDCGGFLSTGDFQVDWSQAPEDANWWVVDTDGNASWFISKPSSDAGYWDVSDNSIVYLALSFNYTGAWQDSLRKRPQENSQ